MSTKHDHFENVSLQNGVEDLIAERDRLRAVNGQLLVLLENVLELGCWEPVYGTEDWRCRWCRLTKSKEPINAPHHEDCAYMVARAAIAEAQKATGTQL